MDLFIRNLPAIAGPPPGTTPNYVNPPSIGQSIVATSLALGILALAVVCLRVATKFFITKAPGWDDAFSVAAILAAIARIAISIILVNRLGIGRHIWDVEPMHFTLIRNLQWIQDMIYLLGIMFAKLSLLILYVKIFRPNIIFRRLCYVMMAVTVAYCIVFIFLYAFNCHPQYYSWHVVLDPTVHYSCIEIDYIIIAIGGFNLGTDVTLLIMPLPLIWKLNLRRNQKWGLLAIFTTGIFVVITTIVRLAICVTSLEENDQTYSVVSEIIWLTVELDVGIICGCLPVLAPLYNRALEQNFIPSSLRSLLSRSFGSSRSTLPRSSSNESTSLRKRTSSDQGSAMVPAESYLVGTSETKVEALHLDRNSRGEEYLPPGRIVLEQTVEQYSTPTKEASRMV